MPVKTLKRLGIPIAGILFISALLVGQQTKQAPQTTPSTNPKSAPSATPKADPMEEAHRGIFGTQPNPAADAVKRSNQAAASVPGKAPAAGVIARRNFIDEHIFGRMERDKIPHAGLASDAEFVRRAYLDATGELPSAEVVRKFVASKEPQKRDKLIDSLVGTEEFAEQWAWMWGDLFRLSSDTGYGLKAFHFWNKEWLRVDRPYNEVVYDLLTPSAKSHAAIPSLGMVGRSNIGLNNLPTSPDDYRVTNRLDVLDALQIDASRIFLGVNTTCISCHDGAGHLEPINVYLSERTRQQFYQMSAFFGKMRSLTWWNDRGKNTGNDDQVIDDLGPGYTTGADAPFVTESLEHYPRNGKTYEPVFLLTGEKPKPGVNPREEFARMLTSNIQFARATVNLLWGKLMVVGFVEPYDGFDMARLDPKNPPKKPWTLQPTNADLLNAMAADFQKHNYSIQYVVRTIMKSNAYQLSAKYPAQWKDDYIPYYARKYVRLMTGPEVFDAITKVTNRPGQFNFSGVQVTRVKELSQPGDVGGRRGGGEGGDINGLLQAFFQGNRNTQVADGNKPSTLQALLMTSSKVINDRVLAEKGSTVQMLLESQKTNDQIIEELFLTTLGRWPSVDEKQVALQALEKDRKRGSENVQWALLNSIEFVLNH